MACIGIIGGSGLYALPELLNPVQRQVSTAYGEVADVVEGEFDGHTVVFIPRHGNDHLIPPHRVNYRANVDALEQSGVEAILAFNVVGGITERMVPEALVVPDQIIDYTYGRAHTYYDGGAEALVHVEFEQPLSKSVRAALLRACHAVVAENAEPREVVSRGVYGCTQGPRLETAAEIGRLRRDGCDVVGMTLMPEAALAREAAIPYASLSLVVNWAAGCSPEPISFNQIMALVDSSIPTIREVLLKTVRFF